MQIGKEIKIIRELLGCSQEDLAKKLNTTFEVINRWENDRVVPENKNIEKVYEFAFNNKIYLNRIYEQMYKDAYQANDIVVLFHGSKRGIEGQIDLTCSKIANDFGAGFYLGETFEQAATYIAYSNSKQVYAFALNKKDLDFVQFNVNEDWMYAIAYYRGWIEEFKDNKKIRDIISKIEKADVVIAPIADNKMFDLIGEYVEGTITDQQCINALSCTNLGYQFVIKTQKGLDKLQKIKEMYLCDKEKKDCIEKRLEYNKIGLDKVKIARIEYKNKGKYIKEALK